MSEDIVIPELGPGVFEGLGAGNLLTEQAVNEIVANSIDAWIEAGCNKTAARPSLNIDINMDESFISVQDNSMGMVEDDLIQAMGLAVSTKTLRPCADELLGMYGFGLKAATSSLGGHFEVISKKKSQKPVHMVMPITEMRERNEFLCTLSVGDQNSQSKINERHPIFDLSTTKSGTYVYITNLRKPEFQPASLEVPLGMMYRFFLKKNQFGRAIEIKLNGEKIKDPPLGPVNRGGMLPFTDIKFKKQLTILVRNSETGEEETKRTKVNGKIWINREGGQYDAGGITTYRRGQCITIREQKESPGNRRGVGGWWSNESARIEGYVECPDFTVNQAKTGLDYNNQVNLKVAEYIKSIIPSSVTDSAKGFNKNLIDDEVALSKWVIDQWYGSFQTSGINVDIPDELARIARRRTRRQPTPGGGDTPRNPTPPSTPPEADDEFEAISEKKFSFRGTEYSIEYTEGDGGGKMFDWEEVNSRITIYIDTNFMEEGDHELNSSLENIAKDSGSGRYQVLSKRLIIQSVINQFLEPKCGKNLSVKYAHDWLKNAY